MKQEKVSDGQIRAALSRQKDAGFDANRDRIREGFWPKFLRLAGSLPFAEDLAAIWYCAKDPQTPFRVRAVLAAAIAYFVMPTDLIPDFVAVLGFTDDALVISTALSLVSQHVTDRHREAAQRILQRAPSAQGSTAKAGHARA